MVGVARKGSPSRGEIVGEEKKLFGFFFLSLFRRRHFLRRAFQANSCRCYHYLTDSGDRCNIDNNINNTTAARVYHIKRTAVCLVYVYYVLLFYKMSRRELLQRTRARPDPRTARATSNCTNCNIRCCFHCFPRILILARSARHCIYLYFIYLISSFPPLTQLTILYYIILANSFTIILLSSSSLIERLSNILYLIFFVTLPLPKKRYFFLCVFV